LAKIICNTSPIQYLHQLGKLELLQLLSEKVFVPAAVLKELSVGKGIGVDLPEISAIDWIEVKDPAGKQVLPLVTDLGAGEIDVLALALENDGCVAVLDDGLARQFAQNLGIPFTGTLGILLDAKRKNLIPSVKPLVDQLDNLGFRVSAKTREAILNLANET
jgi:predicted nucleic acid-binding protein